MASESSTPDAPRGANSRGVPSSFGTPLVNGEPFTLEILLRAILAATLDELGLVIEEIEMWRRSGQVQVDHAARRRSKVGLSVELTRDVRSR